MAYSLSVCLNDVWIISLQHRLASTVRSAIDLRLRRYCLSNFHTSTSNRPMTSAYRSNSSSNRIIGKLRRKMMDRPRDHLFHGSWTGANYLSGGSDYV